ncbi:MAG: C-GCAxxG-C-C family protein [Candidatus Omnitrophica bacterium]|nr:C-GCAxxG-C-C family protein [Candidatus Omnitrophota bacterium]
MKKKASDYFHLGWHRFNCAQSVAKYFQEKFGLSEDLIGSYKDKGKGAAPEGMCGSFFAACALLKDPEDIAYLEKKFTEAASSTKCKEIRTLKKVTCKETVDLAADTLDTIQHKK